MATVTGDVSIALEFVSPVPVPTRDARATGSVGLGALTSSVGSAKAFPPTDVVFAFDTYCEVDAYPTVEALNPPIWPDVPVPTIGASFDALYVGGAKITALTPDGPADAQGLLVDDVIVSCNGTPIASATDLETLLAGSSPGDALALVVNRS